jgi:hypothetical protein
MDVLPRPKLLNAVTAVGLLLLGHLQPKKMYLHEPIRGLNLNRRSITSFETEMPVKNVLQLSVNTVHFLI